MDITTWIIIGIAAIATAMTMWRNHTANQRDEARKELNDVRTKLTGIVKAERDDLNQIIKQKTEECSNLAKKLKAAEAERDKQKKQADKLTKENEVAAKTLEKVGKERNGLKTQVADISKKLTDCETRAKNLEQMYTSAKKDLDALKKKTPKGGTSSTKKPEAKPGAGNTDVSNKS